ncbi:MAG: GUN4 domain-containing protein, partial [Gloeotrichia echinulata HAB0833]
MPTTNKEREIRIAQRRVEGFAQQFGEAHRNLARHAAFPLVLTPDLLYQIWANFVPEAPWTAVAHVLLSRLCRQVGYEMYEMDIADRNLLLRELKEQFGQERFDELGEFLLDYVAQRLTDDDADTQDLREAQEWTALAYTKPDEAARELAQRLSERVQQEDIGEVLRLASLVETLAEPLVEAGFEPLLVYGRGMECFVRQDFQVGAEQFAQVSQNGVTIQVAGVSLAVPTELSIHVNDELLDEKDSISQITIEELKLTRRIYYCLKRAQINSVEDLLKYTIEDLLEIKNFGHNSAQKVNEALQQCLGITLPSHRDYSEASFEKVFRILDTAVLNHSGIHLDDFQRLLIYCSWKGQTYLSIVNANYSHSYIQKIGSKLWNLISDVLGIPFNKSDCRAGRLEWILSQYLPKNINQSEGKSGTKSEGVYSQSILENTSDNTSAEQEVDYTHLQTLLAAGQWKEADRETARLLLKIAKPEKEGRLTIKDIENFPCEDLRTIDKLWIKYSNGHFGFSVQKEIYKSLGGTRKYNIKIWEAFSDRVGWRVNNIWLSYSQITFSINAPIAHLPIGVTYTKVEDDWRDFS